MLPHVDGFTLCQAVRQTRTYTPVLILTARVGEHDRVLGWSWAADDYLIKPSRARRVPPWLFRRVDAFAAKDHAGTQPFIRLLELTIDPQKRRVERHGRELSLTAKHFDFLLFLASHPGTSTRGHSCSSTCGATARKASSPWFKWPLLPREQRTRLVT